MLTGLTESKLLTSTMLGGPVSAGAAATFANLLLTGETDGFAIDATDGADHAAYIGGPNAGYVSVIDTGTPANDKSNVPLDSSNLVQSGTSPKMVHYNAAPYVRWSPHNYATASQTLDNTTYWTNDNATVTANNTTAPDGTATADKVTYTTTAGIMRVSDGANTAILPGVTYTASIYAKKSTYDWLSFYVSNGSSFTHGGAAWFDIQSGVVGSITNNIVGTHVTISNLSISSVGSGWYRCSLNFVNSSDSFAMLWFAPATSDTSLNTRDGVNYLWGAQLNRGTTATPYLATTSAARIGIPQAYDAAASKYGILVEPAATNIVKHSEGPFDSGDWVADNTTVTANATTAPDGSSTASKIVLSGGSTYHGIHQGSLGLNNSTLSVFVKAAEYQDVSIVGMNFFDNTRWAAAAFTLSGSGSISQTTGGANGVVNSASIVLVGNGWYRITAYITLISASIDYFYLRTHPSSSITFGDYGAPASYSGDGNGIYIWGTQMEAGSVATSYIPTLGSTVTRAKDNLGFDSINFGTGTSSLFVWSKQIVNLGSDAVLFGGRFADNEIYFDGSDSGSLYNGGGGLATIGTITPGTAFKIAARMLTNDFRGALNGALGSQDASGTASASVTGTIGDGFSGSAAWNGFVYQAIYLPRDYSDSELQAKTT